MGKPGFVNLTKYTLGDAVGKVPGHLLQGPDTDRDTVEYITVCVKNMMYCKMDILNYTKYKEPYWLRLSIYPVYDGDTPVEYIVVEFDITDKYEKNRRIED